MPDPIPMASVPAPPEQPGAIKRLFVGPHGIRALWSVLIFAGIVVAIALVALLVAGVILGMLAKFAVTAPRPPTNGLVSPSTLLLSNYPLTFAIVAATILMARFEHRSFWTYGFGDTQPLRRFGAGMMWGLLALSTLVGLLALTGHLSLDRVDQPTATALRFAATWALAFLGVGLLEETLARGYLQATLTRGMGFWPAAVLVSVLCGLAHSANKGETTIGLVGAGTAGFVFCYSLWRSGSLWWGIGFHTAWDWAQSYLYGTPDSGATSRGRLFAAQAHGTTWLSGGSVGPEGSVLVFVVLLAVIFVIRWTITPAPGGPYSAAYTRAVTAPHTAPTTTPTLGDTPPANT